MDKVAVAHGRYEVDATVIGKLCSGGFFDGGTGVDGENDGNVGAFLDELPEGAEVLTHGGPLVFASMRGDENDAAAGGLFLNGEQFGTGQGLSSGLEKSVDHRIARDDDLGVFDALGEEGGAVALSGGKMPGGETTDEAPVHLLGKGIVGDTGAEARLDMTDGDVAIEGSESAHEGGGGVALNEDEVGRFLGEDGVETLLKSGTELVERLPSVHHLKVVIGANLEEFEQRREEVRVLARIDEGDAGTVVAKPLNDRAHLDQFRARA